MSLKMGTQKQETIFGLLGWMSLSIASDEGNLQITLHKAHTFETGDMVYISNVISSVNKNYELPGYTGAIAILSVDGNSITIDKEYDSTIYGTEILVSDEYYLYGSMIYAEYISHVYDQMIIAVDPDIVERIPVSCGFTPGQTTFILSIEDAINRYASLRKARLAIEAKLYSVLNTICDNVGAEVVDNVEYLEGISPDGAISIKLASSFKY